MAIPEPHVSIVLPFYNAAGYLVEAIDSIRAQTFTDWELILFDDGSTDGSRAIAEYYASQDSRLRIIPSGHVGIVEALRQSCAEARGRYLARMDADDVSRPRRLEAQLDMFAADPKLSVCGTQVRMSGEMIGLGRRRYEAWVNALVSHEDIVRELFVECPLPHPSLMMRREAYAAAGGYEEHGWAEDHDLLMRFFLKGMRFGKVPELLLDWRESPGRLSMRDRRYAPLRFRALKRQYLFLTYLAGGQRFVQWGAGRVGKPWLREWAPEKPEAVVDIHPRKIGKTIHGIPVIAPEELPSPGQVFIVVAVGAPGARAEIRAWLNPRGYVELRDYLFLA